MAYEFETALIGVVTGALGGVGTALVTPWAMWAVDKRRQQRGAREHLVKDARDGIAGSEAQGWGPEQFTRYEWWLALRPHLPLEVVQDMEHAGGVRVEDPWTTSSGPPIRP